MGKVWNNIATLEYNDMHNAFLRIAVWLHWREAS